MAGRPGPGHPAPGRGSAAGQAHRPHPAEAGSTPERALSTETFRLVERALETLPERQRTVVVLRDVEGWAADEVCSALGVSAGNQRVLLHRARRRLRELLAPQLDENHR